MVGADPNNCSGSACYVDRSRPTSRRSSSTSAASRSAAATCSRRRSPRRCSRSTTTARRRSRPRRALPNAALAAGPGGALSQDDAGVQLQLEDATMRAQFNKTGAQHLPPHPAPERPAGGDDQRAAATRARCSRAVAASSSPTSTSAGGRRRSRTSRRSADPTHLPIYLTDSVLLHIGQDRLQLLRDRLPRHAGDRPRQGLRQAATATRTCRRSRGPPTSRRASTRGRTAAPTGRCRTSTRSATRSPSGPTTRSSTTSVEPWLTPTAPQYGCTDILETGDPVVAIGFAMGTNTFQQGPNPNGTQSADGYYHPEDEVVPAVVHADRAEHRLGADADAVDERRSLHPDGRPQPVPGLPPAGDRLLVSQ